MKIKISAILIFMFCIVAISAIDVSGEQSGTWDLASSPYNIVDEITVGEEMTLTIEPGVEIIGTDQYRITAYGVIIAEGTETDSIYFHSTTDNVWGGIRLENETSASSFSYCIINDTFDSNDNGINSINSPVTIDNCHFSDHKEAISLFALGDANPATIFISNTLVDNCSGSGIAIVENTNVLVENCEITACGQGAQYKGAIQVSVQTDGAIVEPQIQNCYIHNNEKQGFTSVDMFNIDGINTQIENCIFEENLTGVYFYNSRGTMNNCEVVNNFIAGNANSGAGIMVYGSQGYCEVTETLFQGNFTGIYVVNNGNINLGNIDNDCGDDDGLNTFIDNFDMDGNNNSIFANTSGDLYAQNCFWGTEVESEIAETITDANDGSGSSAVNYMPIATENTDMVISGNIIYNGGLEIYSISVIATSLTTNEMFFTEISEPGEYSITVSEAGYYIVGAVVGDAEDEDPILYGSYPELNNESLIVVEDENVTDIDFELLNEMPNTVLAITGNYQENELDIFEQSFKYWVWPVESKVNLYYDENDDVKIFSFLNWNDETLEFDEFFPEQDAWWSNASISEWNSAECYDGEIEYIPVENVIISPIFYYEEQEYYANKKRFNYEGGFDERWFVENFGIVKIKAFEEGGVSAIIRLDDFNLDNPTEHYYPLAPGNYWKYSMEFSPMYPSDLNFMTYTVTNRTDAIELWWDPIYVNSDEGIVWEGYKIYEDGELIGEVPFGTNYFVYGFYRELREYYVTAYNGDFESEPSNVVTADILGIENNSEEIEVISASNFPNPFNPNTTISYSISADSEVDIMIYNIKGQVVNNMKLGNLQKGNHSIEWNGTNENGKSVTSGVYFYKIVTETNTISKRMLLLK